MSGGRLAGSLRRGGLPMWLVVTIGIWAWTVHLLFLSSTAELACEHHSFEWVMHAATALTAGATLAGMAVCLRLVRESPDDEGAPTVAGRNHFLGLLGLLIGGINVALILLEGIYVPFLHACR